MSEHASDASATADTLAERYDLGVVDLMIGFPAGIHGTDFLKPLFKDAESREMEFPAEYMFKDVPRLENAGDPIEVTIREMDKWGVARGMIGVGSELSDRAVREHPDRSFGSFDVDPNAISCAVRRVLDAHDPYAV